MYTQKIANIFDHIQDHSRLGLENKFLENKSRRIFLRSTGLLYKFLPTNLGVFKPTFYNFYTPHLRWNSTIYYTELGQNAVFHNFSRQIALSQYSGRAKPFKNFRKFPKSPIRPAGSRFYSASCQCGRVFECPYQTICILKLILKCLKCIFSIWTLFSCILILFDRKI